MTNTKKHVHTFSCAINCMDGRVQDAVKKYMQTNYGTDYVDMVTEPGPNKILAEKSSKKTEKTIIENIKKRVGISVNHHGAKVIAIAGHHNCAGNPVEKEKQVQHLAEAKKTVESFGHNTPVVLLWVGENWKAVEVK